MTDVNAVALLDALDHIKTNPRLWDQSTYRCRTGMCIAGHGADRAGGEWAAEPDDSAHSDCLKIDAADNPEHVGVCGDDTHVQAAVRAAHVFGLDDGDACQLFRSCNDLPDLELMVYSLTGRRDDVAAVIRRIAVADPWYERYYGERIPGFLYDRLHGCGRFEELWARWEAVRALVAGGTELNRMAIDEAINRLIGDAVPILDEVAS